MADAAKLQLESAADETAAADVPTVIGAGGRAMRKSATKACKTFKDLQETDKNRSQDVSIEFRGGWK